MAYSLRSLAIASVCCAAVLSSGCNQERVPALAGRLAAKASDRAYQQAIHFYREALAQTPQDPVMLFELGMVYYRHGDFANASQALVKTTHPSARKYLALSYYHSGEYASALDAFNRMVKPQDPEALYYHARAAEALNLFDQALGLYGEIPAGPFQEQAKGRASLIEKARSPALISQTDPEVSGRISRSPGPALYPQAGALVLMSDERIEVTPQNTQRVTMHYLVKILNERGKQDFSEAHIEYDSTDEKVSLLFARTIKPDGTVADVGSRHIRDVSKYLNFPLYSNARVRIISFPEVAIGSVIEYSAVVERSVLINTRDFCLTYGVYNKEPVLEGDLRISVPEGREVHFKVLRPEMDPSGAAFAPARETRAGVTTYSWHFKDVPQIIPEPNMPPEAEVNPAIMVSSFKEWGEVYRWWWGLAKGKLVADDEIKAKVKELVSGLASEKEKAEALHRFCVQNIRYVAVEYGQAGYEPHKAGDIFKNKYGDCKDQAVLLATMFREAGLDARLVLIPTRNIVDMQQDFPSVLYDHCIAAVNLPGGLVFMDPTAETCEFQDLPEGDQERTVLIFKDDGFEVSRTPLMPAEHNRVRQTLRLKVDAQETVSAEKSVETFGAYSQGQRQWLMYTPPELIAQSLNERIQDTTIGGTLGSYRVENVQELRSPVSLAYDFKGPEYFTEAGPLRILPVLVRVDTKPAALASRRFPIDMGILSVQDSVTSISLPAGFSVRYLPQDIRMESPWLDFTAEYKNERGTIVCSQEMSFKKRMVSVAEYPAFKRFLEELARKAKQRAVLEKAP